MKEVETDVSFPKLEEQTLEYWREKKIFQRSLDPQLPVKLGQTEKSAPRQEYVFYDGPPFATGLPHYGHLLAGTIKDVIGRFFSMKGFHVDRRFGWDCHGLPVEYEIQKTLELQGAKAIRTFGVANFNEECRKIVLRYTKEWERFVKRSGRWADMSRQYRTMDLHYMESIWWVVRQLWERGLIYEGVKCVPYSWGANTPLSNFEVTQNYRTVQDPAVTVRAPLRVDLRTHFGFSELPAWPANVYIWTTTPWTLPSNMALAVGPALEYSIVVNPAAEEVVVVGSGVAKNIFPDLAEAKPEEKGRAYVAYRLSGEKLVGLQYTPFFPYFEAERANHAFRIYPGEFVTEEEGTGVVHCASFGEEDLELFLANGVPVVDPVDEDGNFTSAVPEFAGLNIKAADPKIITALKENGKLVQHRTIEHSYPFCWRTDTPLIYKSISTWFVKVESLREKILACNSEIHWVPDHIRDGRFGKWLEGARDWAISRNRFWGTPIPIWRCEQCGEMHCIGSVTELEERTGTKLADLHSHFIDELTFSCAKCGATMKRIPQVLDCWFESGSMPYAQVHYPFENKAKFEANFPADFIGEGLDQTRGWFYTLLVLSTALFEKPAFRNVIVNGIVLAEDGKKMSKSLRNYPPVDEILNEFGADAMRLYLLSSAACHAEELRFSKAGVRDVVRQTLLPLWNAYNFFVTYARVDGWSPDKMPKDASPNLLDKWILSKAASLITGVDEALSSYKLYAAAPPILEFVDQLTNWYIRLNRRRFWAGNSPEEREDKLHAYSTLHRVLTSFVRVLAPLAPFISEEIFLNLSRGVSDLEIDSVHLAPFPSIEEFRGLEANPRLERAMDLFEQVILLGRGIRNDVNIKVRQPLPKLTAIHPEAEALEDLKLFDGYLREELNIKTIEYSTDEEKFVSLKAQLNTKLLGRTLGPKLGSEGMKKLREEVEALTTAQLRPIEAGGSITLQGVELKQGDLLIKRMVKPGAEASASSGSITVVLDTNLTQELRLEGLTREFVNRVQKLRKESGLEVTDRIVLKFMTANSKLSLALSEHHDYVTRETLAVEMIEVTQEQQMKGPDVLLSAQEIDEKTVVLSIQRIQG